MDSTDRLWESIRADYLSEVESVLSKVKHPRIKDIAADVRAHLDQRFSELGPEERTRENYEKIIEAMGPASDYAELLSPEEEEPPAPARRRHTMGLEVAVAIAVAVIVLLAAVFFQKRPLVELEPKLDDKPQEFNIDTATLSDVTRFFGEPVSYAWGKQVLDSENLPQRFVAVYPYGLHILISDDKVIELRHEGPGTGYLWRDKLRVGSTLEEALDVLGAPAQVLEGEENLFQDRVLYKDIAGCKGHCYYACSDHNVRLWFADYGIEHFNILCSYSHRIQTSLLHR